MKGVDGVSRLDKLLCLWEDMCFIHNMNIKFKRKYSFAYRDSPLIHAEEFRKYILEYNGNGFDFERFLGSYDVADSFGVMAFLPLAVLSWNHHSRRVFNLPKDVQMLLDGTSLGGITWEEIKYPLDSFLVTLDVPLISDNGTEYDVILLSKDCDLHEVREEEEVYSGLRLLPKKLDSYERIGKGQRKRLESMLHNGRKKEIKNFLKSRPISDIRAEYNSSMIHLYTEMLKKEVIKESIPKLGELTGQPLIERDAAVDSALHIVLNLCLYLENFPAGKQLKREDTGKPRKKKKKTFDSMSIVDECDIFSVACHFKMKKTEITELSQTIGEAKSRREMPVHWRRAHWRRHPNCGHIPKAIAPKTWIPRKQINADRAPKNSVPGGSETTLS